jgi:hypothetical protein
VNCVLKTINEDINDIKGIDGLSKGFDLRVRLDIDGKKNFYKGLDIRDICVILVLYIAKQREIFRGSL